MNAVNMKVAFLIVTVLVITLITYSADAINNQYGNFTFVGKPQPKHLVALQKTDKPEKYTGVVRELRVIITVVQFCKELHNGDTVIVTTWRGELTLVVRDIQRELLLCMIQFGQLPDVVPIDTRQSDHLLKPDKSVRVYSFIGKERSKKKATILTADKSREIFNDKSNENTVGMKLDSVKHLRELNLGSAVITQNFRKPKVLAGVIIMTIEWKMEFYALAVEMFIPKIDE